MTNLEHLIENCLCCFENGYSYEEIKNSINNDINLKYSGISAEQCYEICQYVWYVFAEPLKNEKDEMLEVIKNNTVECIGDTNGDSYLMMIIHKHQGNKQDFKKVKEWIEEND